MKPRVFKWHGNWHVTLCSGYDAAFCVLRPFRHWSDAVLYALSKGANR